MKLLLHTCCGDCLLRTRELLTHNYFDDELTPHLDLYYANSNIYPKAEYDARRVALTTVANKFNLNLIIADYVPSEYFQIQNKLITNKQIGNKTLRCPHCIHLRLQNAFNFACQNNYDTVSSTMLASPYMDRELVNQIGTKLAQKFNLHWLHIPNKNLTLHTKGFYKQNYCGCLFSLNERVEEKYYGNIR